MCPNQGGGDPRIDALIETVLQVVYLTGDGEGVRYISFSRRYGVALMFLSYPGGQGLVTQTLEGWFKNPKK